MKNKLSKRLLSAFLVAIIFVSVIPIASAEGGDLSGVNVDGLSAIADFLKRLFSFEGFLEILKSLF